MFFVILDVFFMTNIRVFRDFSAYINSPVVWAAKLFGYGNLGY